MYSQGYFIDINICIVTLYLLYIAFFHNRISYGIARAYLLLLIPVSMVIPTLNLPLLPAMQSVEQIMINSASAIASSVELEINNQVNYLNLIYFTGLGLISLWLLVGVIKIVVLLQNSSTERITGQKIIFIKGKIYAFTIMNYIFINEKFKDTPSISELIAHESEHIKMHHSFDILYMSVLRAVLWFNPIVWHLHTLLHQLHEYQVDERVIKKGHSLTNYINLLIKSEAGISPEFTSSFGYSFTKKRITMLIEKKRINNCSRLFIIIPVLGTLLFAFSLTTRASTELTTANINQDTIPSFRKFVKEQIDSLNPIYVRDGNKITKKAFDSLDMKTVGNITVLKNGAANKIYGNEGKNGVIIIESKQLKTPTNKVTKKVVATIEDPDNNISTLKLAHSGLYIVDGKEMSKEDIKKLVMDDIESISIIKDVMAKSIYGAKGANGVTIIETKKLKIIEAK